MTNIECRMANETAMRDPRCVMREWKEREWKVEDELQMALKIGHHVSLRST